MLQAVVPETAKHFARALVMPNLVPPVVTAEDAKRYRDRIVKVISEDSFTPLMTLYLTDHTDAADVIEAAQSGLITAVKLYPAGATTNSSAGVTDINKVLPVLEKMAEHGVVLCVHGEVTAAEVDIFDREARFIDTVLQPLRQKLPELRVVMEHITTTEGVQYVQSVPVNQAGTITSHHLMINRNHMLVGGIRPHYYCLPIVKRQSHQRALVKAATSGDSRFFLGTDSAPHTTSSKESACGCAGVFNTSNALSCLAHVFENAGALNKLEGFTSRFGPEFYGLPINEDMVTLTKQETPVAFPTEIAVGKETVTVFDPGHALYWRVE
jgi:dihydroorotase